MILTISASPHHPSKTDRLCAHFEKRLTVPFERLDISKLPPSDGTYETTNRKIEILQNKVIACGGLFISTPTYWYNVPASLKCFIEQLTPVESKLWKRERKLAVAVYAPEGGELGVFTAIVAPLNTMGFSLVGNGYVFHRGGCKKNEEWVWRDIAWMAERFSR